MVRAARARGSLAAPRTCAQRGAAAMVRGCLGSRELGGALEGRPGKVRWLEVKEADAD
jgi:hypothetical protein